MSSPREPWAELGLASKKYQNQRFACLNSALFALPVADKEEKNTQGQLCGSLTLLAEKPLSVSEFVFIFDFQNQKHKETVRPVADPEGFEFQTYPSQFPPDFRRFLRPPSPFKH